MKTAQWKRYPNRSGAARFAAYFVTVELVKRESRQVTKSMAVGDTFEKVIVSEEWAQIRHQGRLRWVALRELSE